MTVRRRKWNRPRLSVVPGKHPETKSEDDDMSVVEAALDSTHGQSVHGVSLKDQALRVLDAAAKDVRSDDTNTGKRGKLVLATAYAFEAKAKRREIAATIAGEDKAYAGLAARYIMAARWHLKKYRKGEHPLEQPVTIAGQKFEDIIDALNACVATWSAVFNGFADAIKPKRKRETTTADSPRKSGQVVASRIAIPMMVNKEVKRVKIADNKDAFTALLQGLLDLNVAKDVLGSSRVTAWRKQLG